MMLIETWGEIFSQSLIGLWYAFITFIPGLIGAIILFIIGWVVGSLIGKAITQLVVVLKVDKLFESAGVNHFIDRSGLKFSVSRFIGGIVKWFIIIVFLMAALQIIGLTQVNDFLREAVLYYLPKVIIASFILVIATVLADGMKKLVKASAQAANIRSANMLGSITLYAIWVFAIVVVLSELGIASVFMQTIFIGFIAALAIALGLSFGLGGKEAASRAIEKISGDMSIK
jgi:small-conductance mechanosensitive channel